MKRIKSGRRENFRLELGSDIFKTIKLKGLELEGLRLVDISHKGLGLLFEGGINTSLIEGQELDFSIDCDSFSAEVTGAVRHAGSKMAGIELIKFKTNREKYENYLDSRIINKFSIKADPGKMGLLVHKIDIKFTLILMLIEAVLIFLMAYFIFTPSRTSKELRYFDGKKDKIEQFFKT